MYVAYAPPKEPCVGLIRSKTFPCRSVYSKTLLLDEDSKTLLLDEDIVSNVPNLAKQATFRSKKT